MNELNELDKLLDGLSENHKIIARRLLELVGSKGNSSSENQKIIKREINELVIEEMKNETK